MVLAKCIHFPSVMTLVTDLSFVRGFIMAGKLNSLRVAVIHSQSPKGYLINCCLLHSILLVINVARNFPE